MCCRQPGAVVHHRHLLGRARGNSEQVELRPGGRPAPSVASVMMITPARPLALMSIRIRIADVNRVGDQLGHDFVLRHRELDHAREAYGPRLVMVLMALNVCVACSSPLSTLHQMLVVRVRVPAAGDGAVLPQALDQFKRARILRAMVISVTSFP